MTREEIERAIDLLDNLMGMIEDNQGNDYDFALKKGIEALQKEPCDDAVSRKAVLEQTYNWSKDEFLRVTNPFDYLRKRINSLPPVTPKREQGKWIKGEPWSEGYGMGETYGYYYTCSKCGNLVQGDYNACDMKYCPNCGAEMAERGEE